MAGKRKNVQSRVIDAFCVIPAREERKRAEKKRDMLRANMYRQIEDYCIERREAAKGNRPRKKKA